MEKKFWHTVTEILTNLPSSITGEKRCAISRVEFNEQDSFETNSSRSRNCARFHFGSKRPIAMLDQRHAKPKAYASTAQSGNHNAQEWTTDLLFQPDSLANQCIEWPWNVCINNNRKRCKKFECLWFALHSSFHKLRKESEQGWSIRCFWFPMKGGNFSGSASCPRESYAHSHDRIGVCCSHYRYASETSTVELLFKAFSERRVCLQLGTAGDNYQFMRM